MSKVVFHNSVSLDGYVAGPNDSPSNPLGDGGGALFEWYFSGDTEVESVPGAPPMKMSKESAAVFSEATKELGVMVCGRRMFDIANAWHGTPPGTPCIVLTHNPPQEWVKEGSPFIFMDDVAGAIAKAKQLSSGPVALSSASIAQQALKLGLLDEIHMAVIPVMLNGGVQLFDNMGDTPVRLEAIQIIPAPGVTHVSYRVVK
jgi:dihydrofolate reductase